MTTDIIESVKELNKCGQKKNCYILLSDDQMAATEYKYKLNEYLANNETSIISPYRSVDPGEETVILFGLVLDPTNIPFAIDKEVFKIKNRSIWIISEDDYIYYTNYGSDISVIAENVETLINDCEIEIDNIAIVIAQELRLTITVAELGTNVLPKHY